MFLTILKESRKSGYAAAIQMSLRRKPNKCKDDIRATRRFLNKLVSGINQTANTECRAQNSNNMTGVTGGSVMSTKTDRRTNVSPKEGEHKYGNVEYADTTNKKYPIDSAEHVRAAWSYIN